MQANEITSGRPSQSMQNGSKANRVQICPFDALCHYSLHITAAFPVTDWRWLTEVVKTVRRHVLSPMFEELNISYRVVGVFFFFMHRSTKSSARMLHGRQLPSSPVMQCRVITQCKPDGPKTHVWRCDSCIPLRCTAHHFTHTAHAGACAHQQFRN